MLTSARVSNISIHDLDQIIGCNLFIPICIDSEVNIHTFCVLAEGLYNTFVTHASVQHPLTSYISNFLARYGPWPSETYITIFRCVCFTHLRLYNTYDKMDHYNIFVLTSQFFIHHWSCGCSR